MQGLIYVAIFLVSAVIFTIVGIYIRKKIAESKIQSAEREAKRIIENAKIEAENLKKEEIIRSKEEILLIRNDLDKEIKERRGEIQLQEKRLIQKEENLEKRTSIFEGKEKDLERKFTENEKKRQELEEMYAREVEELQRISGLTVDQAKQQLLNDIESELTNEKAALIRDLDQKAREEAQKNAKEVIGLAIQKCAADHTSETTVSVVSLPNDEMKGRIIGREGRNIKTLETLTGIDLIIDDTPEAVIISGFDPLRREVARLALEKLIDDGRIHPAKIEEVVEKAKEEVNEIIKSEGERALLETGVNNLHPDIVKLIGKLKYRTSYGQNVLNHSIEVSNLARLMADELGINSKIARRAGLLHDIGKAIDFEMEGSHVEIGADICKKHNEDKVVINAIESHHGDVEPTSIISVIVAIADALSASRPGARNDSVENYIKRLQQLEEIANGFDGIDKSYAIQAGRELRVIVKPEEVDDMKSFKLARDIKNKIEAEMQYPGTVKVTVVRETRAVEEAK